MSLQLPPWLDKVLYQDIGATFNKACKPIVVKGCSDEALRDYLGTYFPRSYAESRSIFTKFFQDNRSCFQRLSELSVLDFGCGAGGDFFGLMDAIEEVLPNINCVNCILIDADIRNKEFGKVIFDERRQFSRIRTVGRYLQFEIINIEDFKSIPNIIGSKLKGKFDIVLTFKTVNEILQRQFSGEGNPYAAFIEGLWPLLKMNGFMCVADLTFKYPDDMTGSWLGDILDDGLHQSKLLECVVARNANSRESFSVSHSKYHNDSSNLLWRIIQKPNMFGEDPF